MSPADKALMEKVQEQLTEIAKTLTAGGLEAGCAAVIVKVYGGGFAAISAATRAGTADTLNQLVIAGCDALEAATVDAGGEQLHNLFTTNVDGKRVQMHRVSKEHKS